MRSVCACTCVGGLLVPASERYGQVPNEVRNVFIREGWCQRFKVVLSGVVKTMQFFSSLLRGYIAVDSFHVNSEVRQILASQPELL